MRRRRPSKQRLRLGSGRYLCCGGRLPDADTHGYCDGDGDAATDANTEVGAIAKAASHAFAQALVFSRLEVPGVGRRSSNGPLARAIYLSKHVARAGRMRRQISKISVDTASLIGIKGVSRFELGEVNITGRKRTRVVMPRLF